jgi:hypothetical protein
MFAFTQQHNDIAYEIQALEVQYRSQAKAALALYADAIAWRGIDEQHAVYCVEGAAAWRARCEDTLGRLLALATKRDVTL